jgi:signal transduction histidine kinase
VIKGTIGIRLAFWYAGMFIGSVLILVLLTYALLASSLRQRDQQLVASTLRDYASRYETGGLPALVRAVELEQRGGQRERLFVRVLGRGQEALFMTMPPGWGRFDVDALPEDPRGLAEAPAMDRSAVLEVASARLYDGTVIQVGKSSEAREELLSRFRTIVMLVTGAVILAGLAGGLVFTRSTLQPVTALAGVVGDIVATGRTDRRVPVRETGDALDELSASFNAMLDRIGALITGMRESLDNVAHDLRTPMTRWRVTAERALATGNADAQREALADCLEESDRILAMLNTLMDISEAETGTMNLSREPVPLLPLLREVIDLYADVAEDRGVSVSLDTTADSTVPGDRDRLRQVFANLLDNAIKYTPSGGRVTLAAEQRPPSEVAVVVTDSGIGIAPDELPRIWDRLYRGDRSRSERGLGLGLSLVQAFVRAHGGRVEVSSQPGAGSRFTVVLPAPPRDTEGVRGSAFRNPQSALRNGFEGGG